MPPFTTMWSVEPVALPTYARLSSNCKSLRLLLVSAEIPFPGDVTAVPCNHFSLFWLTKCRHLCSLLLKQIIIFYDNLFRVGVSKSLCSLCSLWTIQISEAMTFLLNFNDMFTFRVYEVKWSNMLKSIFFFLPPRRQGAESGRQVPRATRASFISTKIQLRVSVFSVVNFFFFNA